MYKIKSKEQLGKEGVVLSKSWTLGLPVFFGALDKEIFTPEPQIALC